MARWHTTDWDTLPENAFRPRGWKGGMTLEGGKGGGSAPAPDPNIGIAQKQLADLATQQWNKFQEDIYPELLRQSKVQESRANEQWALTKDVTTTQLEQAKKAIARYEEGAIPAMQRIKEDADKYNEPGYAEMLASQAMGDVTTQADMARANEAMRQRSYGINPNSGAAVANNQSLGVKEALAKASAATQTRQAAKEIGLQKQANVYNMYAGLPAQSIASTNTAVNATTQGIQGSQSAFNTTANTGSALNAATGTAMQGWNSMGQLGVQKYNADVSAYNAEQQSQGMFAQGLGSAIGSGIALYAKSGSDIRIKQNVVRLGVLDNGIPFYAFEYKPEFKDTWGHGIQLGVMAHEVEPVIPDAVSEHADGYKVVDYAKVMNHGI